MRAEKAREITEENIKVFEDGYEDYLPLVYRMIRDVAKIGGGDTVIYYSAFKDTEGNTINEKQQEAIGQELRNNGYKINFLPSRIHVLW